MEHIPSEIQQFNQSLAPQDAAIAQKLAWLIDRHLNNAQAKIWHRHPVWFIAGNPIVGYSRIKAGLRLMFWSGQSFEEDELQDSGSFKAAVIIFTAAEQIREDNLISWLKKAEEIQWDYKNIVKRKGQLERLK